ncbi:MAG: hypothetical protein C0522_15070 [Rhodocyclaceae bacterium]|nr:hypothetical protein [Rhodocyclaceae bacterium]
MCTAPSPVIAFHGTTARFESFDTERGQLGSHFGTLEQARRILRAHRRGSPLILRCQLQILRPLRLQDFGTFSPIAVGPQLVELGICSEEPRTNADSKATIRLAGFDGVVYANEREGAGDSWIAFDPAQVFVLSWLQP